MHNRKNWTQQQDKTLLEMIRSHSKEFKDFQRLKWNIIATDINAIYKFKHKNGKQCRQRWYSQLNPQLKKNQSWCRQSEKLLFQLQQKHGNQWVKISKYFTGKSDNDVKNYFYSYLRKSFRMINTFILSLKKQKDLKSLKCFQESILNKILSVAEDKFQQKIIILNQSVFDLAKSIKLLLIQLQNIQKQFQQRETQTYNKLIDKIQQFSRSCKKRKQKRKTYKKSIKKDIQSDKIFLKSSQYECIQQKNKGFKVGFIKKQEEIQICHHQSYEQVIKLPYNIVKQQDEQNSIVRASQSIQPLQKISMNEMNYMPSYFRSANIPLFYDPNLFIQPFSFYPNYPYLQNQTSININQKICSNNLSQQSQNSLQNIDQKNVQKCCENNFLSIQKKNNFEQSHD